MSPQERAEAVAAIKKALDIGAVSYDGDGWYAEDAGLIEDYDEGDAAFVAARTALAAIEAES